MGIQSKKITKPADSQGAVQLNELDPSTASASVKAAPKDPGQVDKEPGGMDDYETREHLNTIVKAHQIMSDPVKMASVHKSLGGGVKAFNSLQSLRDYKNDTYGAGSANTGKTASTGKSSLPDNGE